MEASCKIHVLTTLHTGIQLRVAGWAPEPIWMCPCWESNPGHPDYSNFTNKAVLAHSIVVSMAYNGHSLLCCHLDNELLPLLCQYYFWCTIPTLRFIHGPHNSFLQTPAICEIKYELHALRLFLTEVTLLSEQRETSFNQFMNVKLLQ